MIVCLFRQIKTELLEIKALLHAALRRQYVPPPQSPLRLRNLSDGSRPPPAGSANVRGRLTRSSSLRYESTSAIANAAAAAIAAAKAKLAPRTSDVAAETKPDLRRSPLQAVPVLQMPTSLVCRSEVLEQSTSNCEPCSSKPFSEPTPQAQLKAAEEALQERQICTEEPKEQENVTASRSGAHNQLATMPQLCARTEMSQTGLFNEQRQKLDYDADAGFRKFVTLAQDSALGPASQHEETHKKSEDHENYSAPTSNQSSVAAHTGFHGNRSSTVKGLNRHDCGPGSDADAKLTELNFTENFVLANMDIKLGDVVLSLASTSRIPQQNAPGAAGTFVDPSRLLSSKIVESSAADSLACTADGNCDEGRGISDCDGAGGCSAGSTCSTITTCMSGAVAVAAAPLTIETLNCLHPAPLRHPSAAHSNGNVAHASYNGDVWASDDDESESSDGSKRGLSFEQQDPAAGVHPWKRSSNHDGYTRNQHHRPASGFSSNSSSEIRGEDTCGNSDSGAGDGDRNFMVKRPQGSNGNVSGGTSVSAIQKISGGGTLRGANATDGSDGCVLASASVSCSLEYATPANVAPSSAVMTSGADGQM